MTDLSSIPPLLQDTNAELRADNDAANAAKRAQLEKELFQAQTEVYFAHSYDERTAARREVDRLQAELDELEMWG